MNEAITGGGSDDPLAPVIPLFPGERATTREQARAGGSGAASDWRGMWDEDRVDALADADAQRRDAYDRLVRRLRRRALSESEAARELTADGMTREAAAEIVAHLKDRGWLDDAALAEQIIHASVTRRGEGRRAIAMSLTKRGIPREIADLALADLPDDDRDRAVAFAVGKAKSVRGLPRDAALRRLAGQLQRRGYPGSVALAAANEALDGAAEASPS